MFPSNFRIHPSQLSLHFVLAPLLHYPSHLQTPVLRRELHPRQTTSFHILLRSSMTAEQLSKPLVLDKHNGSPRTSLFNDSERPIFASCLRPFKNSIKSPIPLSPSCSCEEGFYEPDYGESESHLHQRVLQKSCLLSSLQRKAPYAPNQYSSLTTQSGTRNHSHSHLPPHSPLPSLLLANNKYQITYHRPFQGSSTLRLLLPPTSLLS